MWIKRSLLESRPDEILTELKQNKAQQEKLSNKLKSLRLTRGGLLSQENHAPTTGTVLLAGDWHQKGAG